MPPTRNHTRSEYSPPAGKTFFFPGNTLHQMRLTDRQKNGRDAYKTANSSVRGSTPSSRDAGSPMGRSTSFTFSDRRKVYFPGLGLPVDGSTLHVHCEPWRDDVVMLAHDIKNVKSVPAASILYE
jgi:hypothetical protein